MNWDRIEGNWKQVKGKMESARRVARTFKFLCPSYYMPGKQPWGAF